MSAKQRIKNHLAYKLGQLLLDYDKAKKESLGGGLIPLLFKLHQIKKEHKTLTKFRKTLELARSDLALPPLQNCPDFNEALWIKTQLTYRLGKVLIECDKAKFKGGYLHFFKKITEAKKDFYAFRQSQLYLIKNKLKFENEKDFDVFLNSYFKLDNLLFLAKDYQALLHTLIFNFTFVMKHLEPIETWLRSEEFKTRYIRTKHPYPPLLNPDILNELLECRGNIEALKSKEVSSEEFKEVLEKANLKLSLEAKLYIKSGLDYRLIPASLAWDLNLSLPKNYKFLFWGSHGVGNFGFSNFMRKLKLNNIYYMNYNDSRLDYVNFYNSLLVNSYNYISIRDFKSVNKFFFLLPLDNHSVYLVRDVISSLKHHINFNWQGGNYLNIINFGMDSKKVWDNRIAYITNPTGVAQNPDLSSIIRILTQPVFHDYTLMKVLSLKSVYIIDMSEIINGKAFETIDKLSNYFGLNRPKLKDKIFYDTIFGEFNTLLPLNIEINQLLQLNQSVIVSIKCKQLGSLETNSINIDNLIQFSHSRFSVFTHKNNVKILQNHVKIYEKLRLYINNLINALKLQKDIEDKKKIDEKQVLSFLEQNPQIAKKFKKILDEEHLTFIKEHRPDIVASWKYYAKFEKICEALMKERV